MKKPLKIAIVGLGVIGGSFALALRKQTQFSVYLMGIDRDQEALDQAVNQGAIDYGELENESVLQEADLVIVTLYPSDIVDFMIKHRDDFKPGAIITDTTGVKGDLVNQVTQVLPSQVDFIFGHPMAGKESQGFAYADGDIFQEANFLITPTERNKDENIQYLTDLLLTIGFKRVRYVDPAEHDCMIAFVSQLCHILAVSLINSDDSNGQTAAFVGDSYRELTRIAKINSDLWTELFFYNKTELLKAMEKFQDQFNFLKQALEFEDVEGLENLLIESSKRRTALEMADEKLQSVVGDK